MAQLPSFYFTYLILTIVEWAEAVWNPQPSRPVQLKVVAEGRLWNPTINHDGVAVASKALGET